MGRPINKRFFGPLNAESQIKVRFRRSTRVVNGWIVRQTGTTSFICSDAVETIECQLVDKPKFELEVGEMMIPATDLNGNQVRVVKIANRVATLNNGRKVAWDFATAGPDLVQMGSATGFNFRPNELTGIGYYWSTLTGVEKDLDGNVTGWTEPIQDTPLQVSGTITEVEINGVRYFDCTNGFFWRTRTGTPIPGVVPYSVILRGRPGTTGWDFSQQDTSFSDNTDQLRWRMRDGGASSGDAGLVEFAASDWDDIAIYQWDRGLGGDLSTLQFYRNNVEQTINVVSDRAVDMSSQTFCIGGYFDNAGLPVYSGALVSDIIVTSPAIPSDERNNLQIWSEDD